jgi:FkbM family methyltransferase
MLYSNPFIETECQRLGIAKSPINTSIYETYSQCNEDLIVEALLRAYLVGSGRPMDSLAYVEIGGNHPVQTSSTYLLYRCYGARGVICDANPKLAAQLEINRPGDIVVNCAVSDKTDATLTFFVAEGHELSSVERSHLDRFKALGDLSRVVEEIVVPNRHINEFLAEHAPTRLDYLSVDVEGLDYALLQAMDFRKFRPAVLQCEHENQVETFVALLGERSYRLMAVTDVNAIFMDATR